MNLIVIKSESLEELHDNIGSITGASATSVMVDAIVIFWS